MCEYAHCKLREEDSDDKAYGGDQNRKPCRLPEHFLDTGVLPCTIIVSCDRLHSLVQSHAYHDEHEAEPVGDSICSDAQVAAVLAKLLVDEKCHETGCRVHQERPHSDGERVLCHPHVQAHDSLLEVERP